MTNPYFDASDPAFRELINQFVAELPERIASIETAISHGDRGTLRRLGHQLKGAAGCYGLHELTEPATALQLVCDADEADDAVAETAKRLVATCRNAIATHEAKVTEPIG